RHAEGEAAVLDRRGDAGRGRAGRRGLRPRAGGGGRTRRPRGLRRAHARRARERRPGHHPARGLSAGPVPGRCYDGALMYLEVFADNPYATNCWLLAAEGSSHALVVDPGFSPERVTAMLEGAEKRPVAVLATHGHSDHIGAAAAVCGTELPLYIHKDDELALSDPVAWGAGFPAPVGRPEDVRPVSDG